MQHLIRRCHILVMVPGALRVQFCLKLGFSGRDQGLEGPRVMWPRVTWTSGKGINIFVIPGGAD